MSATTATPVRRRSTDSLYARIDRRLPLRFWDIGLVIAMTVLAGALTCLKSGLPPVWLSIPALAGLVTALPCRFIAAKIDPSRLARLNGFVVALAIGLVIIWQWAQGLFAGAEFYKLPSDDQIKFLVTAGTYLGSIIGAYAGLAILRRDR